MMGDPHWRFLTMAGMLAIFSAAPAASHETSHTASPAPAHIHGAWELFSALDGGQLTVTFSGPLADIAGVEPPPNSPEEAAALRRMKLTLTDSDPLLIPDPKAKCSLSSAPTIGKIAGADSQHQHKAHERHHHTHGSDVEISYQFSCDAPQRLKALNISAFSLFEGIETIDAVFLSDSTQAAARLTATAITLSVN